MRLSYWVALVIASVGWASGGILTRAAFQEGVGTWTMVAIRVLVAAVLVGAVVIVRRVPRPSRKVVGYGLVQAIFNLTIPYILFTFAYDEASAGFVGLLAALIPMTTAVFAHFMLPDEPLSSGKLLGLFVAFTGVAFLLLSGATGLTEGGRPLLAAVLGITSVASIGFSSAFGKRHAGAYDPSVMTGLQFGLSAIWLTIAMFAIEGAPTDLTATAWWIIVVMAITSTFIPFTLFYWLLERISATNVSLSGYLVPLFVLTGGLIFLDEVLEMGIIIGGALVFAGLLLADRASRRADRPAEEVAETWPVG